VSERFYYKYWAPNGAGGFGRQSRSPATQQPLSNSDALGHPNGLISGHLAVNVIPQKTHSIVLKKKIATRY
jgi:hypothetical protein